MPHLIFPDCPVFLSQPWKSPAGLREFTADDDAGDWTPMNPASEQRKVLRGHQESDSRVDVAPTEVEWMARVRDAANEAMRQFRRTTSELKEKKVEFLPLPGKGLVTRLGAVDGGNRTHSLAGISLVAARAAGAIFAADREPEWVERPQVNSISLARNIQSYAALIRDICECSVAIELALKEPDALLLDGSLAGYAEVGVPSTVLPYFEGRAESTDDPHYEYSLRYKEYIYLFDRLLKTTRDRDILLVGVSKDSRARNLVSHLNLSRVLTDVAVVQTVAKGRTGYTPPVPARYFQSRQVQQFLQRERILDGNLGEFLTSYLILREFRQPVRVDLPIWQQKRFEEVIELMVGYSDGEGFITPPHIVHRRARLDVATMAATVTQFLSRILEEDSELYDLFLRQQRRNLFG